MSTYYMFGPCSLKHNGSQSDETEADGKYLKVCDNTYVFCYYETYQQEDVFLPSPEHVLMDEQFHSLAAIKPQQAQSALGATCIRLPETVFEVLNLTGRQLVVCDDPDLLEIAERVQHRLTSSFRVSNRPRREDQEQDETIELTIPAATAHKKLLIPLELNSDLEKVFRKNQFISMIKNELAKHNIQFWTDIRSFRPDPLIEGAKGKYHPFHSSKLDMLFQPNVYESQGKSYSLWPLRRNPLQNNIFGSGVLFSETACCIDSITTQQTAGASSKYSLLEEAMKEALIISSEIATYALTHNSSNFRNGIANIDVYLMIVSMKVDEAQILHMNLDLSKRDCRPVYKVSYIGKRKDTFNKMMNHLEV